MEIEAVHHRNDDGQRSRILSISRNVVMNGRANEGRDPHRDGAITLSEAGPQRVFAVPAEEA